MKSVNYKYKQAMKLNTYCITLTLINTFFTSIVFNCSVIITFLIMDALCSVITSFIFLFTLSCVVQRGRQRLRCQCLNIRSLS